MKFFKVDTYQRASYHNYGGACGCACGEALNEFVLRKSMNAEVDAVAANKPSTPAEQKEIKSQQRVAVLHLWIRTGCALPATLL